MQPIKSFLSQKFQSTYLKILATEGLDFCDVRPEILEFYGNNVQIGTTSLKQAKSLQSLVAREEIYDQLGKFPEFDDDWKPIWREGQYSSLSHSGQWVFVGTSTLEKIGVDIEFIKPRWKEVFWLHTDEEHGLFLWLWKGRVEEWGNSTGIEFCNDLWYANIQSDTVIQRNFEIFYRLWTIKESVLKLHLSGLDSLGDIVIREVLGIEGFDFPIAFPKSGESQHGIFDILVLGSFQWKEFICFSGINKGNSIAFSIAFFRSN